MKNRNIILVFAFFTLYIFGCVQKKHFKYTELEKNTKWKLVKYNNNLIKDTVFICFKEKGNLFFYINSNDTLLGKYRFSKFIKNNKNTFYIPQRRKYDYDYVYFPNKMVKNSSEIRTKNLETLKNLKLDFPIRKLSSTNIMINRKNDTLIISIHPSIKKNNAYTDTLIQYFFKKDTL